MRRAGLGTAARRLGMRGSRYLAAGIWQPASGSRRTTDDGRRTAADGGIGGTPNAERICERLTVTPRWSLGTPAVL